LSTNLITCPWRKTLLLAGVLVLVTGCALPAPAPTRTPRPRPTSTPPSAVRRQRYCKEVNALLETALYEVLPLCNTKGEEWCAEELIELGKRARNVNAPDSLNAHLLLRDLFVDMVRIRGLRPEARELAIADLSSGIADVQAICR
jgi:hypothetical protein